MTYQEVYKKDKGVRFFVQNYTGSAEDMLRTYRIWRDTEVHIGSQKIEAIKEASEGDSDGVYSI